MDKPIYTQEAMRNAIRQTLEEKRKLEKENKQLKKILALTEEQRDRARQDAEKAKEDLKESFQLADKLEDERNQAQQQAFY